MMGVLTTILVIGKIVGLVVSAAITIWPLVQGFFS